MPRKPKKPRGGVEADSALHFSENDLLGQLTGYEGSTLWLGTCTVAEISRALEGAGVLADLRATGFDSIILKIEPFEEFDQRLRVYDKAENADNLIAEARFNVKKFAPQRRMPETFSTVAPSMLLIEWLLMQNPRASFSPQRPRLPGQTHPGLGQAQRVTTLLIELCEKRRLAGVLNFPQYYHNAFLYRKHFHFYDPAQEGVLQALHRDCAARPLAELSWAIEGGCVRNSGSVDRFEWVADAQILPVHAAVQEYFASSWYRRRVEEEAERNKFALDEEELRERVLRNEFVRDGF